ncbi:hypothetical protein LCGC14_2118100, partial [marine sediment metagenome]
MTWELATSICDQAAAAGAGIVPSGLGEPLRWSSASLSGLLSYIDERSPDTQITIFTSLVAPESERILFRQAVARHRGRILVAITLHYAQGRKPLLWEDSRRVGWEKYEEAALRLRELDGGPREVHVAIQPTCPADARQHFTQKFGPNGDRVHSDSQQIEAWFGLVNDRNTHALAPPSLPSDEPCSRPFEDTFMVLYDGRCVACCQDVIEPGHVVGDLNEQSLMDVWHGEKMVALRQRHLDRNVEGISPCNICARTVSYERR